MSGAALAGAATDTTSAAGALSANPPILLDDPNHVNGSSQISMGTGPNTQTGDVAEVAFTKLKQWAIDQNATNARAFALLGGLTTEALTPGLTLAQLTTQYTVANPPWFAQYVTIDAGLWKWNGAQWVQAAPHVLLQSGIPVGIAPSGSFGNNGAWTSGTNLGTTFYPNLYLYFPPGALYASSSGGVYFVQMTSLTAGTVFGNMYISGDPIVPAAPTALVCTGPGAYTQTTSSVNLQWCNIPANLLQGNGRLKIDTLWTNNNSAGAKNFKLLWGGIGFQNTEAETTNTSHEFTNYLTNRGIPKAQVGFFNSISESVAGGGIVYPVVDTTIQNSLSIQARIAVATDWMIIESFAVEALPATLPDNPVVAATPASAFIVPPGAAVNGYNVNKFFLKPKVSDVSFTNDVTKSLFPGQWYSLNPALQSNPFGTGYVDTPGGLQLNFPGVVSSGTATGGSTTSVVDTSQSWVTNAYYGSLLINVTNGQTSTITANTATTLTIQGTGTATALGNTYLILGAGGAFATQTQNSVAGLIPYLSSANGWYTETAFTLSSNHPDHWPAWWMLPVEHATLSGTNPSYIENDIHEGGFSPDGVNVHSGMRSNIAVWTEPAATVVNNASFGFAQVDWTREHILGSAYNPTTKKLTYWLDGVQQPLIYDTTANDALINSFHYFVILGPSTRTTLGGNQGIGKYVPYTMTCRYISGWSSV